MNNNAKKIPLDIIKEGYLYKQSRYFKQSRCRWLVLKGLYLYSYKEAKIYQNPTEIFDLSIYDKIRPLNTNKNCTEFVLISTGKISTDKHEDRSFIATNNAEMKNWVNCIEKMQDLYRLFNKHHNNSCSSIQTCSAIKNIISILGLHKKYSNIQSNTFLEYLMRYKSNLVNDHHHILQFHLNEDNMTMSQSNKQFEFIHKLMLENGLFCDITKCKTYIRNNRRREKMKTRKRKINDKEILFYIDILDSIHCYFMHSIDIGYRVSNYSNNGTQKDVECQHVFHDKVLSKLKSYLQIKRKNLKDIRGIDRFSNNKFLTNFEITTSFETKNDDNDLVDADNVEKKMNISIDRGTDDIEYSFGQKYNYWSHWFNHKPKYASFKEELLSNKIYSIDKKVFDQIYQKSKGLLKDSDVLKAIKACIDKSNQCQYPVKDAQPLNIYNILSVALYTDYDTLSYKFSTTFRKTVLNESKQDVAAKNREYFNWSKILCETVNCFGTKVMDVEIDAFYHGISMIYFDSFLARFYSPTSTTTKLNIATIFAKNDGVILELNVNAKNSPLRYFNCSFISTFANEDERLFIQPPNYHHDRCYLELLSIRNMSTSENYQDFIKTIESFEMIITDRRLTNVLSTKYISFINDVVLSNENYTKSKYIEKSLNKWANKKNSVKIRVDNLLKYAPKILLLDADVNNLIRFDIINVVFQQITEIKCYKTGVISAEYFESLLSILDKITKLKYSMLNKIWLFGIENIVSSSTLLKYKLLFINKNWDMIKYNTALLISSKQKEHETALDRVGYLNNDGMFIQKKKRSNTYSYTAKTHHYTYPIFYQYQYDENDGGVNV